MVQHPEASAEAFIEGRHRFSAGIRTGLHAALPVVAAGVFILALISLLETLSMPYIGVDINYLADTLAYVDPTGPAGPVGLREGDVVLAIDGRPPRRVPIFGHKAVGQQVVYRVVVQGESGPARDVAITLAPWPLERRLPLFALFTVFLGFWGVGAFLLLLRSNEPGVRLFFLACMHTLGLVVLVAADANVGWANLIMYLAVLGSAPLLVHLHLDFPVRRSYPPALLWGLYGGAALLAVVRVLGDPVNHFPLSWLAFFRGGVRLYWVAAALVAMSLLVHAYATCNWGPTRRQIRLITFGTVAALLPVVVLLFPADTLRGLPLIPSQIGSLALILIPLAYGWAIYRRDLIGLDLFIGRILGLTLMGLILAAGYLALVALVSYGLAGLSARLSVGLDTLAPVGQTGLAGPESRLSNTVIVVLLGLMAVPLSRIVPMSLFRVFYPAAIDERAIARLSRQLAHAFQEGGDLSSLAQQVVRALNLQGAVLLLAEGDRLVVRTAPGCVSDLVGLDIPANGSLATQTCTEASRSVQAPHLLPPALPTDLALTASEQLILDRSAARLWLPFVFDGELLGALLLGPRLTDDAFLPVERRLLSVLAQQVALVIRNAQLVNALRGQRDQLQMACHHLSTSREEERRHLALDLHDGPLQQLAGVRLTLAGSSSSERIASAVVIAQTQLSDAIQELRRICSGLHPLTLDRLGLAPALRSHVEGVARRTKLPIMFTVADDEGLRFSPAVEIAVFRVAQEALTNACKHAQARQVRVYLELSAGRLALTVSDDGRGFRVPDRATWGADQRFGLVSMYQRVQALSGQLEVQSAPGMGTTVRVVIPATLSLDRDGAGAPNGQVVFVGEG
jgi:signal transduction histidine kinase